MVWKRSPPGNKKAARNNPGGLVIRNPGRGMLEFIAGAEFEEAVAAEFQGGVLALIADFGIRHIQPAGTAVNLEGRTHAVAQAGEDLAAEHPGGIGIRSIVATGVDVERHAGDAEAATEVSVQVAAECPLESNIERDGDDVEIVAGVGIPLVVIDAVVGGEGLQRRAHFIDREGIIMANFDGLEVFPSQILIIIVLMGVSDFGEDADVPAAEHPARVGDADMDRVHRFFEFGEVTDGSAGKPTHEAWVGGRGGDWRGRSCERRESQCEWK